MGQTRREFLKAAAMLSGAAGVSGFLPESIRRAFAIEAAPGSTYLDAEHVVILMQENRSFDHAFGTLQGVRGFNDPRAIRQANGNSVFVQTDDTGNSYAPWRLDIRDTRATWMGYLPHTRESQVDAWNEGRHDGWLEAKRSETAAYAHLPLTMGHYTREDIPLYYALADAFTVCDQNYSAAMTETSPNRCMLWTGTIRDEQNVGSRVFMHNDQILHSRMTWRTFPERLQEAGIDWKFYQNELTNTGGLSQEQTSWLGNYWCNILEYFAAYNVEAYAGAALAVQGQIDSLARQAAKIEQGLPGEKDPKSAAQMRAQLKHDQEQMEKLKTLLANTGAARYKQMTMQQRALHDAAFVTNAGDADYRTLEVLEFEDAGKPQEMMVPKGDILHQFRQDVDMGKLPTVSWLSAPQNFCDHPSSPWYGAWYISEVLDILTKNPEVWKKTIFILTYDENDGYFDHAPCFVAADPKRPMTGGASEGVDTGMEYTTVEDELRQGVDKDEARGGPIGMGFRVPMIVASPWSRGGWVNSQVFDHTSTLMFLENFVGNKFGKKVTEENISAWRRTVSGDLTSCFRPQDETGPKLDYLDRDKFVVGIQQARHKELPSNYRKLTRPEIEEIDRNPLHSRFIPHQEQGIRPSCSLPYELYADGGLSHDARSFALKMSAGNSVHSPRAAGAPFNVYLRNIKDGVAAGDPGMLVASYAVKPGDTLHEEFPLSHFVDGRYTVDVHGPNGFYRAYTGDAHVAALQTELSYQRLDSQELTGDALIHLRNSGKQPLAVTVQDNSYKTGTVTRTIAAGQEATVVLSLQKSHGWYDFTVQVEGSSAVVRYAGRVETGRPSFSDPLMGGVV